MKWAVKIKLATANCVILSLHWALVLLSWDPLNMSGMHATFL